MISVYRYYEAKRMYEHYDRFIAEWGDDVPPMVEGQRDYCKLEMEYFRDESIKFGKNLLSAIIFGSIMFYGYYGVYLHG